MTWGASFRYQLCFLLRGFICVDGKGVSLPVKRFSEMLSCQDTTEMPDPQPSLKEEEVGGCCINGTTESTHLLKQLERKLKTLDYETEIRKSVRVAVSHGSGVDGR